MKHYKVTSIGITRDGFVMQTKIDGSLRTQDEIVHTDNEVFKGCEDEYDVEDRYEEFWNRLNGGYLNREIVKVLQVELLPEVA